ncbi:MAG: hypothetical protein K2Y28_06465 [Burkholderiaceae bacterium]|nr:hypothetical protein [Burkholderiaceae bacterium]
MPTAHQFQLHTPLAKGLRELLKQLEARLALDRPLNVYLADCMPVQKEDLIDEVPS